MTMTSYDPLWDGLDNEAESHLGLALRLNQVSRTIASLTTGSPHRVEAVQKDLAEIAEALAVPRKPTSPSLACVESARRALLDFQVAMIPMAGNIREALLLSEEHRNVRRQLREVLKERVKARQAHQSVVKEAQRQAARADAAEAKLAELQGEQS
jgi:hypothetical protein